MEKTERTRTRLPSSQIVHPARLVCSATEDLASILRNKTRPKPTLSSSSYCQTSPRQRLREEG